MPSAPTAPAVTPTTSAPAAPDYSEFTALAPSVEHSTAESFGRGALQGATFGFADEISGALESAFGNKTYQQARDESRKAFADAADQHPTANLVGNLAGGLATAAVPGAIIGKGAEALGLGAKAIEGAEGLASASQAAPSLANSIGRGALSGAGYGALQGLGDSSGDFHQQIKDTLIGGATGGVLGGVLGGVTGKIAGGASAREKEDIIRGITSGEGLKGAATATARKLIAKREGSIVQTVLDDPELRDSVGKEATEALPVIKAKMSEVGTQLKPLDEVIDKSTGGVNVVDTVIAHMLKDVDGDQIRNVAGSETKVKAIKEELESFLNAHGPKDPEGNSLRLGDRLFNDAGRLNPTTIKELEDFRIPTNTLRKEVTRLQTEGTNTLDSLQNRAKGTQIKQDLASELKQSLDNHMDVGASIDPSLQPIVDKRRELNSTFSDLATIQRAIDERGWKEKSQSVGSGGLLNNLFHGAGNAAAIGMAMHGNLPGAGAAYLAGKAPEAIAKLAPQANRYLSRLSQAVATGNASLTQRAISNAITNGVPRDAIMIALKGVNGALQAQQ